MARFRKKPVVVEAVRVRDAAALFAAGRWVEMPAWLADALAADSITLTANPLGAHVRTLEGTMVAAPDDWLIRGVKGEIYPCKPDIFEATYEEVIT